MTRKSSPPVTFDRKRIRTTAPAILSLWLACQSVWLLASPPGMNPSVAVRKHPCLSALIAAARSGFAHLSAHGGQVQLDVFSSIGRALKNAQVPRGYAEQVQALYDSFRRREIKKPNVLRLADWLTEYEKLALPAAGTSVAPELHTLVCIANSQCSISRRPENHLMLPLVNQLLVIAPVPAPDVSPEYYFTNLLGSLGNAYGEPSIIGWARAVGRLREQGKQEDDAYARYVTTTATGELELDAAFGQLAMLAFGKLLQAELLEHFSETQGGINLGTLQSLVTAGYNDMTATAGAEVTAVAREIGLHSEGDFLPVLNRLLAQLETTRRRAAADQN